MYSTRYQFYDSQNLIFVAYDRSKRRDDWRFEHKGSFVRLYIFNVT